ncbi:hypothetical protein C3R44_23915, partial [Mycobacterium tuberculosis]
RWALAARAPRPAAGRTPLLLPFRVAAVPLLLWALGGALLAPLSGLAPRVFVPLLLFSVPLCGVLVAPPCSLF